MYKDKSRYITSTLKTKLQIYSPKWLVSTKSEEIRRRLNMIARSMFN
jgi:hypothetical protein